MTTSRIPAALDAIVTALRASPTLTNKVYDGPEVANESVASGVWVGYDGDPDSDLPAVSFDQEWAGLGNRAKNESFSVTCCVVSWSGTSGVTSLNDHRDYAYQLLGAVEDVLRANPSLGLSNPATFALATGSLYQESTQQGTQARIVFFLNANNVRI